MLLGCSSNKLLGVAKLPCNERTPTSGSNGASVQCTAPTEDIDVGASMVCKNGATLGTYTASKTVYEC